MKKLGSELEFISWIKRDGSGVQPIEESYLKMMQTEEFNLIRLSLSENTFIAINFNAFVVRIKS